MYALGPSARAKVEKLISCGQSHLDNIVELLLTSALKNFSFPSRPSPEVESGRPYSAALQRHSSDGFLNEKTILSIVSVFLVPLR